MKITAAICTYNREKYLPMVMDSILKQTIAKSDFEIIVVDNNSPGNTKEIIEKYIHNNPDYTISYFLETNQGLSHARNRSILESKSPLITFIDDDAYLDQKYLEVIVDQFDENPEVSAIGGKILLHYETVKPSWENKYLNSILGYFNMGDEEKMLKSPQYPRGSNMAFRSNLFDIIGDFDTNFGRSGGNMMGGEEKELFNRVYKNGSLVKYVPDAVIFHCVPVERTTSKFVKTQAIGVGYSQQLSSKKEGNIPFLKALIAEKIKWVVSFGLAIVYMFQGKTGRSSMLLKFRYWVTLGLLTKNPKKYLSK